MKLTALSLLAWSLLAQPSPVGEQRLLVIIVALNGTPDPAWVQQGRDAFFGPSSGSLDYVYRQMSHGKAWFVGDVTGVGVSSNSYCDFSFAPGHTIYAINEEVTRLGFDLSKYSRRVYSIPGYCGTADRGYPLLYDQGLYFSAIFLTLGNGLSNIHHEMGHAFGLAHAGTWNPLSDRGDNGDLMGGGIFALNGPHQEQLRWWDPWQIVLSQSGGIYAIQHQLRTVGGLNQIKIPRADGTFWDVSYQQIITSDYQILYPQISGGASIHLWNGAQSFLVDTQPSGGLAFLDAPLVDGRTFYDSTYRIAIRQISHTDDDATVSVAFNADPPPAPAPPPPPPCRPVGKSGKCK